MLVGRVLVVEFVLHQAGQLAELGNVFAQEINFMHRPQNGRHVAALVEDRQKRLAHVLVGEKITVHQRPADCG